MREIRIFTFQKICYNIFEKQSIIENRDKKLDLSIWFFLYQFVIIFCGFRELTIIDWRNAMTRLLVVII